MSIKGNPVSLVVVGSVGLDTIQTLHDRREEVLGGSVSYACTAASFFTRTGMVGVVGDDFPEDYIRGYKSSGIDVQGLQQVPGKTFRWSGVYEDDMINRRTLRTDLNVFADFMPELPAAYRAAPYLLLGNIAPDLQLHVLDQADQARFVVADTMDLWINTALDPLMRLIRRVNMLMLNDSELRQLTGERSLICGARAVLEMGPRYVVVKKGEHGAMLISESGAFMVPAYPVDEVRDPTGAGDTFAGAFMGVLAAGENPDERQVRRALLYASVAASFAVEDFSLDSIARLTREDIESRMAVFKNMMTA